MSQNAPFTVVPRLTQIALAVKPTGMIADLICPRVPVEGKKFTYTKFFTEEAFTIPDTRVGRLSVPNNVEFGGKDETDACEDFALEDLVPNEDIDNARDANNFDPMGVATERTAALLELSREKRVADMYFNPATYAASLVASLSGTSQWSDGASDPVAYLQDRFDSMLVRPNIGVFGRSTWTQLRRHPKVVAQIVNTGGGTGTAGLAAAGFASRRAVADLLELDDIYVGEAFFNASRKGQSASYGRLWGKHASFVRVERSIKDPRGAMPTFAFTAQWGARITGTRPEPKVGLKGAQAIRVGEQIKELVAYQEAGLFIQNAVA